MPRPTRFLLPGFPHLVTQRGRGPDPVLPCDWHRRVFLRLLASQCARHHVSIWAYCLMPDHYHLILTPPSLQALSAALGRLHSDYSRLLNLERGTAGPAWRGRYEMAAMDEVNCWRAMAHLERNPVRAGLYRLAEFYRWSSAAARLGLVPVPQWLHLSAWQAAWTPKAWRSRLRDGAGDADFGDVFRASTRTGVPMGQELQRGRGTAA